MKKVLLGTPATPHILSRAYILSGVFGFSVRLAASVVALFIVARFSGGAVHVENITSGIFAALILGIGNALVKPALYWVASKVTCVLSCITLGLWSLLLSWFLNGLIFYVAGLLLSGFTVKTYGAALWGALFLAAVNAVVGGLTERDKDDF